MKRPILSMLLSVLLLLPGCTQAPSGSSQEEGLTVLATTYPVYLFARTVAQGVEGVTVERLNTGSVSCLHDYTLSVDDMKKIEGADVIAMNGAGLEDFMDDALAASSAAVIDCSQGVALLENADHIHEEGDGGHDHGHWDPHYWMDPGNAAVMVRNLQEGFALADPDHGDAYARNGEEAAGELPSFAGDCTQALEGAEGAALITFHDGFRYFAQALGLPLLASIEEEEGSEASAMEINEITQLVKEHQLPVIFTEVNGSDATANAISRETGCQVAQLTMLMDGPEEGDLSTYLEGVRSNVNTIVSFFGERSWISCEKDQARQAGRGLLRRLLPEAGGPVGPHPRGGHPGGCVLPPPLRGDRRPHRPQRGGQVLPVPQHPGADAILRHHHLLPCRRACRPAVRRGQRSPRRPGDPPPHRLCAPVPQL